MTEKRIKKKSKIINKHLIKGDMLIMDIAEKYPEIMDFLVEEYGLHCFGCFMASYETLEDGAKVHGIEGKKFEKLLEEINKKVS